MQRFTNWLYEHPRIASSISWLSVGALIAVVVFSCSASYYGNRKTIANGRRIENIVGKLEKQDKDRQKRVNALIEDNARQTLILCKIVINNGQQLTPSEAAEVEMACKDRIKEASEANGTAVRSGSSADNVSGNPSSASSQPPSFNNTPGTPTSQPNSSQPQLSPPSVLDRITRPLENLLGF